MDINPNRAFKNSQSTDRMMTDAQRTEINHRLVKNGIKWKHMSISVFGNVRNDLALSYDDAILIIERFNAWGAQ